MVGCYWAIKQNEILTYTVRINLKTGDRKGKIRKIKPVSFMLKFREENPNLYWQDADLCFLGDTSGRIIWEKIGSGFR